MNGKFAYKLETPVGKDRDQPSYGRGTSTHGWWLNLQWNCVSTQFHCKLSQQIELYKNVDKNGTFKTTLVPLQEMAVFEQKLMLLHFQSTKFWVRVSHEASQIARCDQFKVSQRSELQVALLKEATNPAVKKKQQCTHLWSQGDCMPGV